MVAVQGVQVVVEQLKVLKQRRPVIGVLVPSRCVVQLRLLKTDYLKEEADHLEDRAQILELLPVLLRV